MQTETQSPEQLFDYEVTDSTGNKVGTVDGVWVDDATSELEFIGVKTGWLLGKTHVIPVADAEIGDGSVQVPYSEDQIKGAPSFGTDSELTPEQEDQIYDYYGLDRSTSPSPTGLATGTGTSSSGTAGTQAGTTDFGTSGTDTGEFGAAETTSGGFGTTDTSTGFDTTPGGTTSDYSTTGADRDYSRDLTSQDEERVPLHEENLQVDKQPVEAGHARIRKVVRTDHVSQPVDLAREEVQIERVPAGGDQVADDAFQEEQIDVPVMREEPVVGKEAHVAGEVRVGKTADTETRTVEGDVRREDVEIDKGSGFGNTP